MGRKTEADRIASELEKQAELWEPRRPFLTFAARTVEKLKMRSESFAAGVLDMGQIMEEEIRAQLRRKVRMGTLVPPFIPRHFMDRKLTVARRRKLRAAVRKSRAKRMQERVRGVRPPVRKQLIRAKGRNLISRILREKSEARGIEQIAKRVREPVMNPYQREMKRTLDEQKQLETTNKPKKEKA